MSNAILCAEQICLSTSRGKCLLGGVDFELRRGQIHALLGPNGAGKSTLLKVLSGDISVDHGEVFIEAKPLGSQSKLELAKQRAVLPQLNTMAFPLSVEEVVAMGRYPYADRLLEHNQLAVTQSMQQAGITHLSQRSYPSLSGGEQQRTQLARVLAQDTDILLLDEPLSALDIAHQLQTMELLKQLAEEGKAIVIVLHDINLALRYTSHVTLLQEGKVFAQGNTAGVLGQKALREVFFVDASVKPCDLLNVPQTTLLTAM